MPNSWWDTVLGRLFSAQYQCRELCMLIRYATRYQYFHNGEFPGPSSHMIIRMVNSTSCQAVIHSCRRQDRRPRGLRAWIAHGYLLFSIIPDLDLLIPTHPSLALCGQDREECHLQSLLSNPFTIVVMTILDGVNGTVCNAQQCRQCRRLYGNRNSKIVCLTHGETVGLTVSTWLIGFLHA